MAGDMDIRQHSGTYVRVMALLKWGAVACALIAALVVWLIS